MYDHLQMDHNQMGEIAGMVRERYPKVPFPNVFADPVHRGISGRERIEGRQAIVMEHNNVQTVASITSEDYMLIPHEWAVWRFEEAVSQMPQYGAPQINIGLYSDGAKMRLSATFPEIKVKIGGKDPVSPRAGIKNSYDLSMEWESWFGAMQQVCTNGLMAFKKLSNGGGKHRMSLDLEANISQLSEGMIKLDEQYGVWNKWYEIQLDETRTMKMLESSPLSEKQAENVLALPELGQHDSISQYFERKAPISGWFLNSMATQYFEHEMEDTPSRLALNERWTDFMHKQLH
jgi:hypothetical protein